MTAYSIRVWAGIRKLGRCRACREPIVWRVNTNGRSMPFNPGALVLHQVKDAEKGTTFDVLSRADCHFTTCAARHTAATLSRPAPAAGGLP